MWAEQRRAPPRLLPEARTNGANAEYPSPEATTKWKRCHSTMLSEPVASSAPPRLLMNASSQAVLLQSQNYKKPIHGMLGEELEGQ